MVERERERKSCILQTASFDRIEHSTLWHVGSSPHEVKLRSLEKEQETLSLAHACTETDRQRQTSPTTAVFARARCWLSSGNGFIYSPPALLTILKRDRDVNGILKRSRSHRRPNRSAVSMCVRERHAYDGQLSGKHIWHGSGNPVLPALASARSCDV